MCCMHADAYSRARRLLNGRSSAEAARWLGVLHSLLILGLLVLLGLLISLLATEGTARFPTVHEAEFPSWITQKPSGRGEDSLYYRKTGLFPLVSETHWSQNPAHRVAALGLERVLR